MTKVDYGLDAPGVVRSFAIAGAVLALVTIVVVVAGLPVAPELFGLGAVMFLAAVAAMIHSSRRGKLLERDRLLDGLRLGGDEEVLDVGCSGRMYPPVRVVTAGGGVSGARAVWRSASALPPSRASADGASRRRERP